MESDAIIEVLSRTVPASGLEAVASADGMPTFYVAREQLVETARALKNTPELGYAFLADLLPVDYYPREPRFEIVYLLASLGVAGFGDTPKRLRVKFRVPGTDPRMPTLSGVWKAMNWAEREVYDLFGVHFDGHPDLRRILMPEDWDGHPARKDYPVQIKMAPRTTEPLQVTEAEFRANLEQDRLSRR